MYTTSKPYPYLPNGREILYVPETDSFMQEAKRMRNTRSTDKKHPTGAVVKSTLFPIGMAANQAGLRFEPLIRLHESVCLRRLMKIRSGEHYWLCPGCASPANHAEALAIRDAKRLGQPTKGADLYLYGHWWCCESCWKAMIIAGIRNVYLVEGATEKFS